MSYLFSVRKKIILAGLIFFTIQTLFFLYIQCNGRSIQSFIRSNMEYNRIIEILKDMEKSGAITHPDDYRSITDEDTFKSIKKYTEYITSYHENIEQIIKNSAQLREVSVFGEDSGFSYNNILKTENDFKRVRSVKLHTAKIRGVEKYLEYTYTLVFVFIFAIYCMYEMMREDDFHHYIFAMKNGRGKHAAIRGGALVAVSVVFLIFCTIMNLIVTRVLYGSAEYDVYIQNIPMFMLYPYPVSISGYIIIHTVKSILIVVAVVCLTQLVFILFINRNIALLALGAIIGIEYYLAFAISVSDKWSILRNINIFSMINVATMDSEYRNISLFSKAVSVNNLRQISEIVFAVIMIVCSVFIYAKRYPLKTAENRSAGSNKVQIKKSVFMPEIKKICLNARVLKIVVILLTIYLYILKRTTVIYTDFQKEMDSVYAEHQWNYDKLAEYVNGVSEENNRIMKQINELQDKVNKNEANIEELSAIGALQVKSEQLNRVMTECYRKVELYDKVYADMGISIAMIPDIGYEEMAGKRSVMREFILGLVIVCMSVVMAENVLLVEERNKMYSLIRSAKIGAEGVWKVKLRVLNSVTLIVWLMMELLDIVLIVCRYKLNIFRFPIQSISSFSECRIPLSLTDYLIIRALFYLCVIEASCMITVWMTSMRLKSMVYFPAVIISFVCITGYGIYSRDIIFMALCMVSAVVVWVISYLWSRRNWIKVRI